MREQSASTTSGELVDDRKLLKTRLQNFPCAFLDFGVFLEQSWSRMQRIVAYSDVFRAFGQDNASLR
jgi:hypothetical protein